MIARRLADKYLPVVLAVAYYGLPVLVFAVFALLSVAAISSRVGTAFRIPLLLPLLGAMYLSDRAAQRLPKWPRRSVRALVALVGGVAMIALLIASERGAVATL